MTVMTAAAAAVAASIGATIRGPFADESLPRDLGAGAAILAAAAAIRWAGRELEKSE